jgi:hypothetical protein
MTDDNLFTSQDNLSFPCGIIANNLATQWQKIGEVSNLDVSKKHNTLYIKASFLSFLS